MDTNTKQFDPSAALKMEFFFQEYCLHHRTLTVVITLRSTGAIGSDNRAKTIWFAISIYGGYVKTTARVFNDRVTEIGDDESLIAHECKFCKPSLPKSFHSTCMKVI